LPAFLKFKDTEKLFMCLYLKHVSIHPIPLQVGHKSSKKGITGKYFAMRNQN
jgi:hypothetical protein